MELAFLARKTHNLVEMSTALLGSTNLLLLGNSKLVNDESIKMWASTQ
jgi:hypothetical protein